MALKEIDKKGSENCNASAASLLARVQSKDVEELFEDCRKYLAPLIARREAAKENIPAEGLHGLAKKFCPFLGQLLRLCFNTLIFDPNEKSTSTALDANREIISKELFATATLAVDCLRQLRSCLKGRPYEVEVQQYNLLRRLSSWKKHEEALVQGWDLYRGLCALLTAGPVSADKPKVAVVTGTQSKTSAALLGLRAAGTTGDSETHFGPSLPNPKMCQVQADFAALVVGTVLNIITNTAECSWGGDAQLTRMMELVREVEPWLRDMDADTARRHRDMLFRSLYKCALRVTREASSSCEKIMQDLIAITLAACTSSSSSDHFVQVAEKASGQLTSTRGEGCQQAVQVYHIALDQAMKKLKASSNYREFLELVASFCKAFQLTSNRRNASNHIQQLLPELSMVAGKEATAFAGLYAAALELHILNGLLSALEDNRAGCSKREAQAKQKDATDIEAVSHSISRLLTSSQAVLASILPDALGQKDWNQMESGVGPSKRWPMDLARAACQDKCDKQMRVDRGSASGSQGLRTAVPEAIKVLDFVRKAASKLAEARWKTYLNDGHKCQLEGHTCRLEGSATRKVQTLDASLQSTLELLVKVALSFCIADADDKESQQWQLSSAASASLAIVRLSLANQQKVKDSITLMLRILGSSLTHPDDAKWLISSTYNMGVQLYNLKRYSEAVEPFRLTYKAALLRAEAVFSLAKHPSEDTLEHTRTSNLATASDACSKCNILADTLRRSGETSAAVEELKAGLQHWGWAADLLEDEGPRPLVRQWVKTQVLAIEAQSQMVGSKQKLPQLIGILEQTALPLSTAAMGALLQEEITAYDGVEPQHVEACQTAKCAALDTALLKVYDAASYPVQRARLLLERGRLARLMPGGSLASCLAYVEEAILLLDAKEEDFQRETLHTAADTAAVAYGLRGLCAKEFDPESKTFLKDLGMAIRLWSGMMHQTSALSQPFGRSASGNGNGCSELGKHIHSVSSSIGLLLAAADLLGLEGQSELQQQALQVAVAMASLADPKGKDSLPWRVLGDSRLSHVLCPVYCQAAFKLTCADESHQGSPANCQLSHWRAIVKEQSPGSLLDAWLVLEGSPVRDQGLGRAGEQLLNCTAPAARAAVLEMERLCASNRRTVRVLVQHGGLHYLLANEAQTRGAIQEALYHSAEALRLRFSVFSHMFTNKAEDTSTQPDCNGGTAGGKREQPQLPILVATGEGVTSTLPIMVANQRGEATQESALAPSQWRILGDYLESLYQIGCLWEMMGLVDEAEKNFKEGGKIAKSLRLLYVEAAFASASGEAHRKRRRWEDAEADFSASAEALRKLQMSSPAGHCQPCWAIFHSQLERRRGDLARRRHDALAADSRNESRAPAHRQEQLACSTLSDTEVNLTSGECRQKEETGEPGTGGQPIAIEAITTAMKHYRAAEKWLVPLVPGFCGSPAVNLSFIERETKHTNTESFVSARDNGFEEEMPRRKLIEGFEENGKAAESKAKVKDKPEQAEPQKRSSGHGLTAAMVPTTDWAEVSSADIIESDVMTCRTHLSSPPCQEGEGGETEETDSNKGSSGKRMPCVTDSFTGKEVLEKNARKATASVKRTRIGRTGVSKDVNLVANGLTGNGNDDSEGKTTAKRGTGRKGHGTAASRLGEAIVDGRATTTGSTRQARRGLGGGGIENQAESSAKNGAGSAGGLSSDSGGHKPAADSAMNTRGKSEDLQEFASELRQDQDHSEVLHHKEPTNKQRIRAPVKKAGSNNLVEENKINKQKAASRRQTTQRSKKKAAILEAVVLPDSTGSEEEVIHFKRSVRKLGKKQTVVVLDDSEAESEAESMYTSATTMEAGQLSFNAVDIQQPVGTDERQPTLSTSSVNSFQAASRATSSLVFSPKSLLQAACHGSPEHTAGRGRGRNVKGSRAMPAGRQRKGDDRVVAESDATKAPQRGRRRKAGGVDAIEVARNRATMPVGSGALQFDLRDGLLEKPQREDRNGAMEPQILEEASWKETLRGAAHQNVDHRTAEVEAWSLPKAGGLREMGSVAEETRSACRDENSCGEAGLLPNKQLTQWVEKAEQASMGSWALDRWRHCAKGQLARALVQQGKCYTASQQLQPAEHALFLAYGLVQNSTDSEIVAGASCSSSTMYLSSHPVEEASVLLNRSRVILRTHLEAADWSPKSCMEENVAREVGLNGRLGMVLPWLHRALVLCLTVPLLLREVAGLLALLYSRPMDSPWLSGLKPSEDDNWHWAAAFFHTISIGCTVRQQHLAVVETKILTVQQEMEKVGNQAVSNSQAAAKECLEEVQQALRLGDPPRDLAELHADFKSRCLEKLPAGLAICSVSTIDLERAGMAHSPEQIPLDAREGHGRGAVRLLVSRISPERPPVVLLVCPGNTHADLDSDDVYLDDASSVCSTAGVTPAPLHERYGGSVQILSDSDEEGSCGTELRRDREEIGGLGVRQIEKQQPDEDESAAGVRKVLVEFEAIIEESRQSTSSDRKVETRAEKNEWWEWRLRLDLRMAGLLRAMEDSLLGPWKCLLLPEPAEPHIAARCQLQARELATLLEDTARNQLGLEKWPRNKPLSATMEETVRLLYQAMWAYTEGQLKVALVELLDQRVKLLATKWSMGEPGAASSINRTPALDADGVKGTQRCVAENKVIEVMLAFQKAYRTLLRAESEGANSGDLESLQFEETNGETPLVGRVRREISGKKDTEQIPTNGRDAEAEAEALSKALDGHPVELILDADLQALPWESLPMLKEHRVYRMPSVASTLALLAHLRHAKAAKVHGVQPEEGGEGKGLATSRVAKDGLGWLAMVDPKKAFYLLNPSGDLAGTQAAFEEWFQTQRQWQGIVGKAPTPEEYTAALQDHDLFVYCGHGSGEQYLSARSLRKLRQCAAAFLMGCSSGRLSPRGDYEPCGIPLSYLMAGCPTAVANLWDVTDGDIDRFSRSVLQQWLEEEPMQERSEEVKMRGGKKVSHATRGSDTSGLHEGVAVRRQVRAALTPAPVKGRNLLLMKTPASVQDVATSDAKQREDRFVSDRETTAVEGVGGIGWSQMPVANACLSQALVQGRKACRLQHLIGASPVCYGIPVQLRREGR